MVYDLYGIIGFWVAICLFLDCFPANVFISVFIC